ncbi:MAG: YihY/virulence factor BrkB family protein [Acidobacteriaceae bacterium]|nr:YihY/virulence factor BrkB family protein [Acidobacteriaceae bacterium]MBV9500640.1 YihY/virulence factor BrkB family protein [Acidobacteriaceae bacterium]
MSDVQTIPGNAAPHSRVPGIIIEESFLSRMAWLLKQAFVASYEDNCFSIAKGAAYSFLLSLFPILTTITLILIQANARSVVRVIATFVRQVVPPGAEDLILSRFREGGARPISLPIVAVLLSLWAGSGAMISLMEGFEAAYRIPSGRPFFKQRAMAIFLVLIAAFPAVGASLLILFGNRIEVAFIHWIGVSDISAPVELAWKFSRYLVAFCTITFVNGLLYYFGPRHRPEPPQLRGRPISRFMRVWPGAFLASVLWFIATAGFAWYVGHRLANYNFFYGSIGTVIVLLIWLYLLACIALIGCEFNAERERIDSLPALP